MTAANDSSAKHARIGLDDLTVFGGHQVGERLNVLHKYLASGVPVLDAAYLQAVRRACLQLQPALEPPGNPGEPVAMADVACLVSDVRAASVHIVQNWDVQHVGSLIDLLPGLVNPRWRDRALSAHMDEKGEWIIEFDRDADRVKPAQLSDVGAPVLALSRLVGCAANPSRLAQLMPQVHAAQARFNEDLPKASGADVLKVINDFDRMLKVASMAFFLDTADHNGWDKISMAIMAKNTETLEFGAANAFVPTKDTATRLQAMADRIRQARQADAHAAHSVQSDDSRDAEGDAAPPAVARQRCTGG